MDRLGTCIDKLRVLGTLERRSLTSAAIVAAVENFCTARARPLGVRAAASGHRHDVNAAP